jgi:hypothetical protein
LPNGKHCSLATYRNAWNKLKTLKPDSEINGWEWYPVPARDILRQLRAGMHNRINRHIPGYSKGRKWSVDYQHTLRREARMIHDYTQRRIIHPHNRLSTPELQRRFQWNYTRDGLEITLYNARVKGTAGRSG